jgi:hypothetical protein
MMNNRIFFVLLFLAFHQMFWAEEPADILWQQTEKIASQNWALVPGRIHKVKKVYRKNGTLKSSKEVTLVCSWQNDAIVLELVQARTNKKELTEDNSYVQEEMEKDYTPQNNSIFHNNDPYQVKINNNYEADTLKGTDCRIYQIEFKMQENGKEVGYIGKLWLDAKNGTPLKLEKTCRKLPPMVSSFLEITEYSLDEKGHWIMHSETTITEATIVFMRLKMEIKYTYSDYWDFPGN